MKTPDYRKILAYVALLFFICVNESCQKEYPEPPKIPLEPIKEHWEIVQDEYIVVLNKTAALESKQAFAVNYPERLAVIKREINSILSENHLPDREAKRIYGKSIYGFAVTLNKNELATLEKDPRIKYIEPDRIIVLEPIIEGSEELPKVQTTPWGIIRVGNGNGTGKTAWIIDTGIDLDHPDLNVDVAKSISYLSSGKNARSPNDENGHGTHVAGILGAINNNFGVIGVAANATLISVRVLNQAGIGRLSDVIAGIDHVAAHGQTGHVANVSLGGGISQALDNAVVSASSEGILFTISAGNNADNANNYSPARANGINIFTISAMNSKDNWATFSNFGNPPIDYCAPGVSIYSTWKDSKYKTISGTSMSAPHVAGLLLITNNNLNTDGFVKGDPDNVPDPIAHN